jgi:hypothetical protein
MVSIRCDSALFSFGTDIREVNDGSASLRGESQEERQTHNSPKFGFSSLAEALNEETDHRCNCGKHDHTKPSCSGNLEEKVVVQRKTGGIIDTSDEAIGVVNCAFEKTIGLIISLNHGTAIEDFP